MNIPSSKFVDAAFTKALPKVELHAHLTGSISPQCLHEIWQMAKVDEPDLELEDPLIAMGLGKNWDIDTFFPLFTTYIYRLVNTPARICHATLSVLTTFANDNVIYLELRTTPRASPALSTSAYIALVLDTIDAFSATKSMTVRLILSVDRKNTAMEALATVDLAIQYQPRGVVAIDICGNPARGDVSIYREALAKAKRAGLKLTLHFAEVPASSTLEELTTMLAFGPERLGHVIHVPEIVKREIAERRLALELCLTCNVSAKMIEGGYEAHHFGYWQQTQCPLILCTDDVGVFGSPLSNEYLLAAEHFGLDRKALFGLCQGAIGAIFGDEEEKIKLRTMLNEMEKREIGNEYMEC